MRKLFLVAGLCAAAIVPTWASAQTSCQQQQDNRVVGTVAGAGIGALVGDAVAPRGDRTAGALVGAGVGAFAGNQMTRPDADCTHAYGFYDRSGMWHATSVQRSDARGYYDRDGAWVDGAPNGYYGDDGRWVVGASGDTANGYYDSQNRWVPASANGYYDTSGQWVAGAASGYYGPDGHWVAGPATGAYDADGHWVPGAASGHRDADGVWVADAQRGYYDSNGHWRSGAVHGYYDAQGRWIATNWNGSVQVGESVYRQHDSWAGAPNGIHEREAWLDQRIRAGQASGALTRDDADQALLTLAAINREDASLRRDDGHLGGRDRAIIQARLDQLSANLSWQRPDMDNGVY